MTGHPQADNVLIMMIASIASTVVVILLIRKSHKDSLRSEQNE